ncbi:MAG: TonB-dependent receptor plug domain-containing protein, partial [Bacteroidetes bacterium]|nr:TonB-dependent receptor plug domain-containing protein [Bacteroidota bacterium]
MTANSNCLQKILFLFLLLGATLTGAAQTIRGKALDAKTGEPLVGATVLIEHTRYASVVMLDGSFVLKNIPAGTYSLKVKSLGYADAPAKEIVVSGSSTQVISFSLEPQSQELSVVAVTSRMNGDADNSARRLEKNADLLENILSAKTIQLSPDVTVANALQRISGVTIQRSSSGEGRYAIIRGMDERYNTTLVNGVKIPSPDPKYRYVPMDLFPSDMLERLEVIKSLTPAMEGDAVGGTMNLVMKNAPGNFTLTAHAGTGFSTLFSSSRPFSAYQHGAVSAASPAEIFGNNYAATQNDFSRANLNFTKHKLPFNSVAGLTIGGRVAKNKLGIIFSGAYQDMFRGSNSDFLVPNAQPQVVNNLDNQAVISDLYIRKYSTQTTRFGLHNKLDYIINDRNHISLYNMYVHMNEFQTRETYDSVYLNKLSDNLMRSRTQRQSIYSSTLQGDHILGSRFRMGWTGSYALAKGAMPDMAEYDVQSKGAGVFIVEKMSRQWQHNTDQNLAGYLNFYFTPSIAQTHAELSWGGMYRHKSRNNYYNDYSLSPVLTNSQPQVFSNFNSANYLFSPANLGTGAVSTANPNTYKSYEDVAAGYLQLKFMATAALQVLGGARVEYTRQHFSTVMPESYPGREGQIEYADLLPGAQLKYALT